MFRLACCTWVFLLGFLPVEALESKSSISDYLDFSDLSQIPPTATIPIYDCSKSHKPKYGDPTQYQIYNNGQWWTQTCPNEHQWNQEMCRCDLPDGVVPCSNHRSDTGGSPEKYQQFVNGHWMTRECSLGVAGLVWDQSSCRCVWGPFSSGKITGQGMTPCDVMLNMTFENGVKDDAKGSFVEVARGIPASVEPVGFNGKTASMAAYFYNTALNIWFFSNNELGTSLRLELKFKMEEEPKSRDTYQILVSNGCNVSIPGYTTPSVAIGYRPSDQSYLLAFETVTTRKAIVCTQKLGAYDWHTVSLIYEDGTLLLRVDGNPCIISQDFSGHIQKTACPLTIGADPLERESMYNGYIDDIIIARYCRRYVDKDNFDPSNGYLDEDSFGFQDNGQALLGKPASKKVKGDSRRVSRFQHQSDHAFDHRLSPKTKNQYDDYEEDVDNDNKKGDDFMGNDNQNGRRNNYHNNNDMENDKKFDGAYPEGDYYEGSDEGRDDEENDEYYGEKGSSDYDGKGNKGTDAGRKSNNKGNSNNWKGTGNGQFGGQNKFGGHAKNLNTGNKADGSKKWWDSSEDEEDYDDKYDDDDDDSGKKYGWTDTQKGNSGSNKFDHGYKHGGDNSNKDHNPMYNGGHDYNSKAGGRTSGKGSNVAKNSGDNRRYPWHGSNDRYAGFKGDGHDNMYPGSHADGQMKGDTGSSKGYNKNKGDGKRFRDYDSYEDDDSKGESGSQEYDDYGEDTKWKDNSGGKDYMTNHDDGAWKGDSDSNDKDDYNNEYDNSWKDGSSSAEYMDEQDENGWKDESSSSDSSGSGEYMKERAKDQKVDPSRNGYYEKDKMYDSKTSGEKEYNGESMGSKEDYEGEWYAGDEHDEKDNEYGWDSSEEKGGDSSYDKDMEDDNNDEEEDEEGGKMGADMMDSSEEDSDEGRMSGWKAGDYDGNDNKNNNNNNNNNNDKYDRNKNRRRDDHWGGGNKKDGNQRHGDGEMRDSRVGRGGRKSEDRRRMGHARMNRPSRDFQKGNKGATRTIEGHYSNGRTHRNRGNSDGMGHASSDLMGVIRGRNKGMNSRGEHRGNADKQPYNGKTYEHLHRNQNNMHSGQNNKNNSNNGMKTGRDRKEKDNHSMDSRMWNGRRGQVMSKGQGHSNVRMGMRD